MHSARCKAQMQTGARARCNGNAVDLPVHSSPRRLETSRELRPASRDHILSQYTVNPVY
jgi:hypothetical protein